MSTDTTEATGRRHGARFRPTVAGILAAGGVVCLLAAAPLSLASAATLDAPATIASPGTSTALDAGGSTTQFTVSLPANADCSGDTATDGYHIFSYLVPAGTSITSLTFASGTPSAGYGLVDTSGTYYGDVNTAIGTGQIVSIPNNLEFEPLVSELPDGASTLTGGTNAGVWDTGIACANTSGVLSDYWTTQITFATSSSDPNGSAWTANASTSSTTTTTAGSGTTTTDPGSGSTTTTVGGASTTTTSPSSLSATGTGSGDTGSGTGASTGTGSGSSGSTGTSSGNLATTGIPIQRFTGYGLLVLGAGLILLGWRSRRRRAAPGAPSPW